MIKIDFSKNITISKGDSVTIQLKFNRNITTSEYILFTVKKSVNDTATKIYKYPKGNGTNTRNIELSHDDTDLDVGQYWYDIRIITGQVSDPDTVETPFEPKKFVVIDVVKDW